MDGRPRQKPHRFPRTTGIHAYLLVTVVAHGAAVFAQGTAADHDLFENKIRPVLQERCSSCHGEDKLGHLDLSSRRGLLAGGASGPVVTLGEPDASLLIQAVRHEVKGLEMPLTGGRLSEQEIGNLEEWVRRGAPWPEAESHAALSELPIDPSSGVTDSLVTQEHRDFWSFRPLEKPTVPLVESPRWSANPIDRFIKSRLDAEGLEPNQPASKGDLLRRVSFDLTGLPPTPKQLAEFDADHSASALSNVVERLLASPHYGERWGRHWLDVVRYGEDDTRSLAENYQGKERYPQAFRYRDWVVEAFNDDLPWSQFIETQLAADLMPIPDGKTRQDLLPALGLLGAGPWYYDLADPPIARADERHDRVDVTTRGFLALTVGCARCHNHKYDPIPITDYYALAGVFSNSEYHEYPIGGTEQVDAYERDKEFRKLLESSFYRFRSDQADLFEDVLLHQVAEYMMAVWEVSGEPQRPVAEVANDRRFDLEQLQRFVAFANKDPEFYPNLIAWQAMIAEGGEDDAQKAKAQELANHFERELIELSEKVRKLKEHNDYLIASGSKPPRERKSVPMPNGFESFFDEHQLELESLTREETLLARDVFAVDVHQANAFEPRKPGLLRLWNWALDRHMPSTARAHVETLGDRLEELEDPAKMLPFVMGVRDLEHGELADLPLHLRGSPTNLGAPVPRHFPTVLCEGPPTQWTDGSGRLQLAHAIAQHPLSARVIVNRVWRWHFGRGLVDTPSNFGIKGERPSHPALLEYLAAEFLANGQSIKWLHRVILGSQTYGLASQHATEGTNSSRDPDNRLYWRANRRRLNAEEIRDSLLVAAGSIDATVAGPSLDLEDAENHRRTIYSTVSRFQLHPFLQTFDFPNPSLTAERRFETNVPLQNLYFMNSPFVRQQAERLAKRLAEPQQEEPSPPRKPQLESSLTLDSDPTSAAGPGSQEPPQAVPPSDAERIRRVYLLLFGRAASESEIDLGLAFLRQTRRNIAPVEARDRGDDADNHSDSSGSDPSWVSYLRSLFNTNEFRFLN